MTVLSLTERTQALQELQQLREQHHELQHAAPVSEQRRLEALAVCVREIGRLEKLVAE